jgi:hypothetical protein
MTKAQILIVGDEAIVALALQLKIEAWNQVATSPTCSTSISPESPRHYPVTRHRGVAQGADLRHVRGIRIGAPQAADNVAGAIPIQAMTPMNFQYGTARSRATMTDTTYMQPKSATCEGAHPLAWIIPSDIMIQGCW